MFSKDRFCQLSFKLAGEFGKGFYVCYNVLQANGGKKDNSQMTVKAQNRTCLPDLEVGSFRNSSGLHISSRGSSTVRHEVMH